MFQPDTCNSWSPKEKGTGGFQCFVYWFSQNPQFEDSTLPLSSVFALCHWIQGVDIPSSEHLEEKQLDGWWGSRRAHLTAPFKDLTICLLSEIPSPLTHLPFWGSVYSSLLLKAGLNSLSLADCGILQPLSASRIHLLSGFQNSFDIFLLFFSFLLVLLDWGSKILYFVLGNVGDSVWWLHLFSLPGAHVLFHPPALSVTGTCDFLLTNGIWDVTSISYIGL